MGKNAKVRIQKGKLLSFLPTGEYYFKKGLKAYHRRDYRNAKKYLQRALQLEPGEPMIVCQLAIISTELGEYENSNRLLKKVLEELDEEMAECHYFLANNYAYMGLFKDAFQQAKLYLELDPEGDFAEDAEDLLELLTLESDDLDDDAYEQDDLIMKQEEARSLLESGYFPKAIAMLKSVIKGYPKYWSAYNNLALAYFYLGDIDKAEAILDDVLKRNPGNLHALCNRLVFAHYQEQSEKEQHFTRMLKKIQPILSEHQFKLGATFALIGEYELGYIWLKKLYKQGFDGDGPFYYWLSYSAYFTGHENFARTIWKKVLEINPDKEGFEPWNRDHDTIKGFEDHSRSITRKLESEYVEERLFGVFLISVSSQKAEMLAAAKKDHLTEPELDYLGFLELGKHSAVEEAHDIAMMLYRFYHPIGTLEAGLYLLWFSVFLELSDQGIQLKNKPGWTAAIEYVWHQLLGEKISQQQLAQRYSVSTATVGKYAKMIKQYLQ